VRTTANMALVTFQIHVPHERRVRREKPGS
jgi:hypothetical protein